MILINKLQDKDVKKLIKDIIKKDYIVLDVTRNLTSISVHYKNKKQNNKVECLYLFDYYYKLNGKNSNNLENFIYVHRVYERLPNELKNGYATLWNEYVRKYFTEDVLNFSDEFILPIIEDIEKVK